MITVSTGIDPRTGSFTLNVNSWDIEPPFGCGVVASLQPTPEPLELVAVAVPEVDDEDEYANG